MMKNMKGKAQNSAADCAAHSGQAKKNWLEVDIVGMRKSTAVFGSGPLIYELVQNGWDTNATEVRITLEKQPGRPYANLVVFDNDPDGFKDLKHAFTLYAESEKKWDPEKRGVWNLGEKLVLCRCEDAQIESTKGTVIFSKTQGRKMSRKCREFGTCFSASIRMNTEQYEECCAAVLKLIPPEGVQTYFNEELLSTRDKLKDFEATLPTVISNEDGELRRTRRKTGVGVFRRNPGEKARLHELGIPVVEMDTEWHIVVGQKVPLNMTRDNVPPSFLKELRTAVLNNMIQELPDEAASASWVIQATENDDISDDVAIEVMHKRFGDKVVIFDPMDHEANKTAVAKGYRVIHGRDLTAEQWKIVRRTGIFKRSGFLFPTPTPTSSPHVPDTRLPIEKWTPEIHATVDHAKRMGSALLGFEIDVEVHLVNNGFLAWYGGGKLNFNLKRLGYEWFKLIPNESINDLIIHEFGHEFCSDHLDSKYYKALTRLGAQMVNLALDQPELFEAPF
ncbi:MAG: hypothetical protein HQL70_07830 [Magnetococcales bacterium]|nr:hypothetical protein [Magnetococcales bacterium]